MNTRTETSHSSGQTWTYPAGMEAHPAKGYTPARTAAVLADVAAERQRQVARYGLNADLEDGTGPLAPWLVPLAGRPAVRVEQLFREDYEQHERVCGKPTWMHLVREEVAEAFQEDDPTRLREELVQLAALAVSWVETLDARAAAAPVDEGQRLVDEALDEYFDAEAERERDREGWL